MLISHFSELDGNNGQRFFDKYVFELPIIKTLRLEVRRILQTESNPSVIVRKIKYYIKQYNTELLEVKESIINSFIEHIHYWYDKAIKQYGKAIQLGIDDATPRKSK